MRKSKLTKKPELESQKKYSFKSCDDSNGPVEYITLNREILPGSVNGFDYIKSVKPYASAVADGIAFNTDSANTDLDLMITNSDVLYQLVTTGNTSIISTLQSKYDDIPAINGAITSSLRYGDLLMMVTAAEARKTYEMVKTVFIRFFRFILDMYKAVKNLNVKDAYGVLSNAWLEMRYGWRPLYGEIKTLYEKLSDNTLFNVKSAYGNEKYLDLQEEFMGNTSHVIAGEEIRLSHKITVTELTYKAGFNYFNSVGDRNTSLAETLGLSFKSLLSTAHELIPFSFILDMFLNLGNYIKTLDWRASVNPFNGYKTTRFVAKIETFISQGITASGNHWFYNEVDRNNALECTLEEFYQNDTDDSSSVPPNFWNIMPARGTSLNDSRNPFDLGKNQLSFGTFSKDLNSPTAYNETFETCEFSYFHIPGILDKYSIDSILDSELPPFFTGGGKVGPRPLVCHKAGDYTVEVINASSIILDSTDITWFPSASLFGFVDYKYVQNPITLNYVRFKVLRPFSSSFKEFLGEPIDIDAHCYAIEQLWQQHLNDQLPFVDTREWLNEKYLAEGRGPYPDNYPSDELRLSFWEHVAKANLCALAFDPDTQYGTVLNRKPDWESLRGCTFRTPHPSYKMEDYRQTLNFNIATQSDSGEGEIVIRQPHSNFEFLFDAEVELDIAQMTDLAVFAERLGTALKKRYL